MSKYATCSEVPFQNLVKFLEACSSVVSSKKEQHFNLFMEKCVPRPSPDIFLTLRMLMPAEDTERRNYGLTEDKLAELLVETAGLHPESPHAKHALQWRETGVRFAGNFPLVMEQYVLRMACLADNDNAAVKVTVADINQLLERLSLADNHWQQVVVMREFLARCNALQMRWVLRVILKDIKIGMTKERMLRAFHRDALDLLNITLNLKQVCEELADQVL